MELFNPKSPVYSCAEVRDFDRYAIEELKIPGIIVMENAGRVLTETLLSEFAINNSFSRVLILKGDAALNLDILEHLADENLEIIYFDRDFFEHSLKELRVRLSQADIVVDAMLGTGAHGEPRFPIGDIIDCVNSARKRTFAVDIPSGLDGDTGEVVSCAVRAGITCTLGAFKKGFAHHGAQEYTGKIFLADIGVARSKLTKQ